MEEIKADDTLGEEEASSELLDEILPAEGYDSPPLVNKEIPTLDVETAFAEADDTLPAPTDEEVSSDSEVLDAILDLALEDEATLQGIDLNDVPSAETDEPADLVSEETEAVSLEAVSYTHLTLPTIYSV